jgi:hypothetical protein
VKDRKPQSENDLNETVESERMVKKADDEKGNYKEVD